MIVGNVNRGSVGLLIQKSLIQPSRCFEIFCRLGKFVSYDIMPH